MVVYPIGMRKIPRMLIKRILASLILAAIGIPAVIFGGYYFFALITILLGIAAWEYWHIFKDAGVNGSEPLLVGGVVLLVTIRVFLPGYAGAALALLILFTMSWHLVEYERGRNTAATDFSVTVGGIVYLGWVGAFLMDLRTMESGLWWFLSVLPSIWIADTAAYFVGSKFGRHPLTPRLSPKKTWEGYWAGVFFGTVGGAGLALLWHGIGGPEIPWWQGAILGGILSILTTLGDLGESMIKRQAGVKDSSNIIPGHGGVFDRLDSWIWGGALGFFIITVFFR